MVLVNNKKLADIGYYINLDKRPDRNEQILKNIQDFNISGIKRFSARCDEISPNINLINTTLDIYKAFLKTDFETLLIIEDDCKFLEPLKKDPDNIISDIYSVEWDLFWLGCFNRRTPIYYKNNCYNVSSVSHTQSYMIKRKMAEDILNWQNGFGFGHIDEFLCLFSFNPELAYDPNKYKFYEKDQPLDCFEKKYITLTYKYALTTQYDSYSDLWIKESNLSEYLASSHPEKYINE